MIDRLIDWPTLRHHHKESLGAMKMLAEQGVDVRDTDNALAVLFVGARTKRYYDFVLIS
jgi:hypothetical protein